MAEKAQLIDTFAEFGGLDLRSHDVNRKPRFARDCLNAELTDNNSMAARPGSGALTLHQGMGGIVNYIRNNSDRSVTEEIIGIDSDLYRARESTLLVAYNGAEENPAVAIMPTLNDDGSYSLHFFLYINDEELLDIDLGTGLDEGGPTTLAELMTEINSTTDFNSQLLGDETVPAGFLSPCLSTPIDGSNLTEIANGFYWEKIYCPTGTPFQTFYTDIFEESFENACMLPHNDVLYIATGKNKLYKYDGVSCYAAGMPDPAVISLAQGAAGALTGTYTYSITYEQIDARGNVVEGNQSDDVSITIAAKKVTVTIPCITTSTEFLISLAYANNGGTQTGTIITVDNGAGGAGTLQIGQTAFFRDNAGALQELEIFDVTATTIQLSDSVTIANNEPISANLRINLWRNKQGDPSKYLVRTFANRADTASFNYTDEAADSALGEEYSQPAGGHSLPRENLKYLTVFQNQMASSDGNASQFFVHDLDGPEYRFDGFDYILLRTKSNHPVTGLGANREVLAIFKTNETHALQGDLSTGNIRVELVSSAVGCDSFHTIQDVDSSLWFYSGKNGVQRLVAATVPQDLSYRVLPAFKKKEFDTEVQYVHKRAVACTFEAKQQYILYLPCLTDDIEDTGTRYPNDNSRVFVADYRSQEEEDNDYDKDGRLIASRPKIRWFKWNNLNMIGGIIVYEENLFWMQWRFSVSFNDVQFTLMRQLNRQDETDYTDVCGTYEYLYEAGWDDLNEPDLEKKFISATVYSFDENSGPAFNVYVHNEVDFRNDVVLSKKLLTSNQGGFGSGWGDFAWGDVSWGSLEENRRIFPLKNFHARAIKLVYSATVFMTRPVVSGWIVQAVPAFMPKQRK